VGHAEILNWIVLYIFHVTARMLQSGFLVALSALSIMDMNFLNILSECLDFPERFAEILHNHLHPVLKFTHVPHWLSYIFYAGMIYHAS
jgi:hypothetical protein